MEVCLMNVPVLPTHEVRSKIGEILNRLQQTGEPIFVSRHGKAEAVLLSMDRYSAMIDLLEDREDEQDVMLGQRIQEEREAYSRGEGRDLEVFVTGLEL
jgi:prevent-host-death family protein